jgi:hypothetical protein
VHSLDVIPCNIISTDTLRIVLLSTSKSPRRGPVWLSDCSSADMLSEGKCILVAISSVVSVHSHERQPSMHRRCSQLGKKILAAKGIHSYRIHECTTASGCGILKQAKIICKNYIALAVTYSQARERLFRSLSIKALW